MEISQISRAVGMHRSMHIEQRFARSISAGCRGCIVANDPEFEPYFSSEEQVTDRAVIITLRSAKAAFREMPKDRYNQLSSMLIHNLRHGPPCLMFELVTARCWSNYLDSRALPRVDQGLRFIGQARQHEVRQPRIMSLPTWFVMQVIGLAPGSSYTARS